MTSPYLLPDGNVQISFSGGRTSAFMLHQILQANGDLPDRCQVMFANTGREMPQTLDFVHECSMRWNVPIIWLEYDRPDDKVGFKVVNHNSCSKAGEPFELLIRAKQYLPNPVARYCTAELKIRTMKRYLVQRLGWQRWSACIGIRADETQRLKYTKKDRWSEWYPLAQAGITKREISHFWQGQPFDLQLENVNGKTPLGNCDLCFLKSEKTLAHIAKTMPDRLSWWADMEKEIGLPFYKDRDLSAFSDYVNRQADWVFDDESFFCQADGGECTG